MTASGRGERGAVLAGVLCIAAAVLALAAGWFEMSTAQLRSATGLTERVRAFHAADAALEACAGMLAVQTATQADATSERSTAGAGREPGGSTLYPFAHWPGVIEPPACRIEALGSPQIAGMQFYLVTAHARSISGSPPLWLQLQIAAASGAVVERRWRQLAGQPR